MRLMGACSDALVPGLTRRLLLAVLATLAPAVAASPAGAAGHSTPLPVKARPNVGIVNIYTTLGYQDGLAAGTGMIISARVRSRRTITRSTARPVQGRRRHDPPQVQRHRRRLLGVTRHRRAATRERVGSTDDQARRRHPAARRDADRRPRERAGSRRAPSRRPAGSSPSISRSSRKTRPAIPRR